MHKAQLTLMPKLKKQTQGSKTTEPRRNHQSLSISLTTASTSNRHSSSSYLYSHWHSSICFPSISHCHLILNEALLLPSLTGTQRLIHLKPLKTIWCLTRRICEQLGYLSTTENIYSLFHVLMQDFQLVIYPVSKINFFKNKGAYLYFCEDNNKECYCM